MADAGARPVRVPPFAGGADSHDNHGRWRPATRHTAAIIDPQFDPAPRHALLQRDGRVQVGNFLQLEVAQRLRSCLQTEVPWTLALRDADGARTIDHATYAAMPAPELAALLEATAAGARAGDREAGFRFAYDSYMMVKAYKQGRDPGLLLHRVLELFNTPEYIALMQALTGDARVRRINAQATRYRRGRFLRYHTDIDSTEAASMPTCSTSAATGMLTGAACFSSSTTTAA